jgi:hypothetical protein
LLIFELPEVSFLKVPDKENPKLDAYLAELLHN